jgi:transcriptional antiterminator
MDSMNEEEPDNIPEEIEDDHDIIEGNMNRRLEEEGGDFLPTEEELGYISYHFVVWKLPIQDWRPYLPGIIRYIRNADSKTQIEGVRTIMSAFRYIKAEMSEKEKRQIEEVMKSFTERFFAKTQEERAVKLSRGVIEQYIVEFWIDWSSESNRLAEWLITLSGAVEFLKSVKKSGRTFVEYMAEIDSVNEENKAKYEELGKLLL